MKPSFHPRLINDVFSDPGLFIPFMFQRGALLFDLGDLSGLSTRDMLKISHIFVTHTHMDHFIGFDQLLRLLLGRDKELYLFGPTGFLEKVEAKLGAYTWNLIEEYENTLVIHVTEIQPERGLVRTYTSRNRFRPVGAHREVPFTGNLVSEKSFSVDAVILDHKIDCLGLSVREHFSVNIIKEGLEELGLPVGPWLREFKNALYEGRDGAEEFRVAWLDGDKVRREKGFTIGQLKKRIARISSGQKITYLVDMIGSPENIDKAVRLARGSQHLFIEAPFLDRDGEIARRKYHLTAREAGIIASRAGAKELTIFHFSPRYIGREGELMDEAMEAFRSGR
ncbi:MAG: ribonuclease Z [Deltaproteobacteria bacterium]|nr:MAG: ribonuclease Z [Deltaproteobacteria bacterium]